MALDQVRIWPADHDQHFTLRAVLVGLAIGILVGFCNLYFGLQTGWGNGMSIPSSLMGFAVFRIWARQLRSPLTPTENVLIQTVATATGSMPMGSGFTGIMPAIDFLLRPSEGAPVNLSLWRLFIWALGICLFGVIFAVPLRREVVVREKLAFPTGTATAVTIGILHRQTHEKNVRPRRPHSEDSAHELLLADDSNNEGAREEADGTDQAVTIKRDSLASASLRLLIQSFGISGFYILFTYFVPQTRDLPIFGASAARNWLWTLNPSPAYVGQGIIMGPSITCSMLLGAVVGWGVLSPVAKNKGWAPGQIGDWDGGSKGWIAWVALVIMLTDALINLCWFVVRMLLRYTVSQNETKRTTSRLRSPGQDHRIVPRESSSTSRTSEIPIILEDSSEDAPPEHLISNRAVLMMFVASLLLCVVFIQISFSSIISPFLTIVAVGMAVLLSIMGVRATGETDLNPASGISKFTQLAFGLFVSRDNPHRIVINLLAGQVADSGAGQAGDMMQDLKTGHLLGASPKAQFYGAVIGSCFGAVVSPFIYKLYTSVYELPSNLFPIPQAHIWIFAARLVSGTGLPEKVGAFALGSAVLFMLLTTLRLFLAHHRSASVRAWHPFVPNGIAVAMGMYNPPAFTLARACGGTLALWWLRHRKYDETAITVLASGCLLGEGVVSVVNLAMTALRVPHL